MKKLKQLKIESYIYARKSSESDEKQVASIPKQIAIAKELAVRDDVTISEDRILSEERSAKYPGRSVFNDLMAKIEVNDHTTIYCWIFSRISRNSKDDGWVRHLIETGKLTVIASDKKFDKSTNSIVTAVEGAQNTQFSRDLGKMIEDNNQDRRRRGIYPGPPPPGYKMEGPRGQMIHVPDDERFRLIQRAIHRILAGTTPAQSLRILNNEEGYRSFKHRKLGGGLLAESSWYAQVLRNPFYCGKFICFQGTSKEQEYQGIHQPMISEEEFWQLQDILAEKGRPRPRLDIVTPFMGLLKCGECGNVITRDIKYQVRCTCGNKYSAKHRNDCPKCGLHKSRVPKKRHHEYNLFRCSKSKKKKCFQGHLELEGLKEQILARLEKIAIPQEFVDWALEDIDEENDKELQLQEDTLTSLQKAYDAAQKELARHNQMFVKGYVSEAEEFEWKTEKEKKLKKRDDIKKKIDNLQSRSDEWRDATEDVYIFAKNAKAWFEAGDSRTKSQILADLGVNAQIKDKQLTIDIQPPFIEIENTLNQIKEKYPNLEPGEIEELLGKNTNTELIGAMKLTWLLG